MSTGQSEAILFHCHQHYENDSCAELLCGMNISDIDCRS